MASRGSKKLQVDVEECRKLVEKTRDEKELRRIDQYIKNGFFLASNSFELVVLGLQIQEKLGNFGSAKEYVELGLQIKPNWEAGQTKMEELDTKIRKEMKTEGPSSENGNPGCGSSGIMTRSKYKQHGVTPNQSLDDKKPKKEGVVAKYVITEEEQQIIEKAHQPTSLMLNIVKKQLDKADGEKTAGEVMKNSLVEFNKHSISKEVEFCSDISFIWSGSADKLPTLSTTVCWKDRQIEKGLAISVVLYFKTNGWIAMVAKPLSFEECSEQVKNQITLLEEDHKVLLEKMRSGTNLSFGDLYRSFMKFVEETYPQLNKQSSKFQIPLVKKVGDVFHGESRWFKDLELKTSGQKLQSGMGVLSFLSYGYNDTDVNPGKKYSIILGDTVIITPEGGRLISNEIFDADGFLDVPSPFNMNEDYVPVVYITEMTEDLEKKQAALVYVEKNDPSLEITGRKSMMTCLPVKHRFQTANPNIAEVSYEAINIHPSLNITGLNLLMCVPKQKALVPVRLNIVKDFGKISDRIIVPVIVKTTNTGNISAASQPFASTSKQSEEKWLPYEKMIREQRSSKGMIGSKGKVVGAVKSEKKN